MEIRTGLEDKPWWVSALVGLALGALLLLANRCVLQDLTDITDRQHLPATTAAAEDRLAGIPVEVEGEVAIA